MTFGIAKLNRINVATVAAESYFILYSSEVFYDMAGIAVDSDKNIYMQFTDSGSAPIIKVSESGTIGWRKTSNTSVTGSAGVLNTDGSYVYSDRSSTEIPIIRLSGTDGSQQSVSNRTFSSILGVSNVVRDSSGNIYMAIVGATNPYKIALVKYSSSGVYSSISTGVTKDGSTAMSSASPHLTIDSSNNIYVATRSQNGFYNYIMKFDTSLSRTAWYQLEFSVSPSISRLRQVAVDSSGNMFGGNGQKIWSVNSSGTRRWEKSISLGTVNTVTNFNVDVDSLGNVYFFGFQSNAGYIYKLDNSTGNLTWARKLVTSTSLNDFAGRIFNDQIYVFGLGYVTGTTNGGFVMKVPTDGTKTGTYGNFVYSTPTVTLTNVSEMTASSVTTSSTEEITVNTATITRTHSNGTTTITKSTL